MGTTLSAIHLRTETTDKVARIARQVANPAFLAEPQNGWISLYPLVTEDQDPKVLARVAIELSHPLECSAFAFQVYDSDYFHFLLVENGRVIDRYYSNPGFNSNRVLRPKGGDATKLLPYCVPGVSEEYLEDLLRRLHERPMTAVERAAKEASERERIAKTFGKLPAARVKFLIQSKRSGEGSGRSTRMEEIAATLGSTLGMSRERAICSYRILELGLSSVRTSTIL